MSPSKHVIIFARPPELGKVKTRLATTLGDGRALEIYEYLLAKTKTVVDHFEAKKYIFLTHKPDGYDYWDDTTDSVEIQATGNLGVKMSSAFKTVENKFTAYSEPKIIVGTDCPDLDVSILTSAFEALKRCDVVIGPTFDGGYYLIGMKENHSEMFDNIPWSTEDVLSMTLEKLRKHKLRYALLPQLRDIDFEADWLNWLKTSPKTSDDR